MDDLYIRKVCEGDENAFRYFIQQYKDMAFSISVSVVKDEFAAQEIVQDAFVKAFRHISSYKKQASFSTWFYRIVTNEALMHLRKNKNDLLVFPDDEQTGTVDESVLQKIKNEEQAYWINEALRRLPPKESLVLRLFYLQEESIKQVCEITGWSEANTKVILHRARKNMFNVLTNLLKSNP